MLSGIAFILGTTLMYATPLLYTALGGALSENAGVVNIGLEGMMTMGAFVGAAVGFYAGDAWIGFIAAALAGGFMALIHAVACITFKADHTVSGIAINFLGPGFALFFSRIFFDGATQTKSIDLNDKIPRPLDHLFSGTEGLFARNSFLDVVFNQYATVYLVFILVFVVWFLLYKTRFGLRLRSVGEHPRAADTLGINVFKYRYIGVILSGVFAGMGGASMSVAVVSRFSPTLISGQGFIALAALIFGKWKPRGAMWACLLFGAAQGLVIFLGGRAGIEIPSHLLAMLPYVLTLVILVGVVGKAVAPTADGIPYIKEGK